jgi:hypothetical protein
MFSFANYDMREAEGVLVRLECVITDCKLFITYGSVHTDSSQWCVVCDISQWGKRKQGVAHPTGRQCRTSL